MAPRQGPSERLALVGMEEELSPSIPNCLNYSGTGWNRKTGAFAGSGKSARLSRRRAFRRMCE